MRPAAAIPGSVRPALTRQDPDVMSPTIAIIDGNSLECMAMRSMLSDMSNGVELLVFQSVEAFLQDSEHFFVHFFVSAELLFRHPGEFDMLKRRTIVLGKSAAATASGYRCLDLTLSEAELARNLLRLYETGHHERHIGHEGASGPVSISDRERDVLRLIVKGLLNKEIAEELNLSVPTVIFHRNKLCRKLGTRSIARMTIYAVLSGMVDLSEL